MRLSSTATTLCGKSCKQAKNQILPKHSTNSGVQTPLYSRDDGSEAAPGNCYISNLSSRGSLAEDMSETQNQDLDMAEENSQVVLPLFLIKKHWHYTKE